MDSSSITTPSSTIAPMAIRQCEPTRAPWSRTACPSVTWSPISTGSVRLTWITVPSWMLVWCPMRIRLTSARMTHWNHTLECAPSSTSPMTWALSSTNAVSWMRGVLSWNARSILSLQRTVDSESEKAQEQGEMVTGGVHARNRKAPAAAPGSRSERVLYSPMRRRSAGAVEQQGAEARPFCWREIAVPTYDYRCDRCERTFEIRQRISAEPLTTCDRCGGPIRRLLSAAPFILKGGGWYVTDYPSDGPEEGDGGREEVERRLGPERGPGDDRDGRRASTASRARREERRGLERAAAEQPKPTPTPSS